MLRKYAPGILMVLVFGPLSMILLVSSYMAYVLPIGDPLFPRLENLCENMVIVFINNLVVTFVIVMLDLLTDKLLPKEGMGNDKQVD